MATAFGLLAQNKMLVNLKNGKTVEYSVSDIESVNWEIREQSGDQQGDQQVNQHEYVDLGLPSGLKWATCNIGATSPEDYVDYFAWGETEPHYTAYKAEEWTTWKTDMQGYSWSTYKWCNGSYTTQTKYNTNSSYGTVDNKTVLEPVDDAATANWGGSWRMPTQSECQELCDNCTFKLINLNHKAGYKVTGPNGNWIFFPSAGYYSDYSLWANVQYGDYWSNTLNSNSPNNAYRMYFSPSEMKMSPGSRYYGYSVRPVTE